MYSEALHPWIEIPINRIFVLVAIALALLVLRDYLKLVPLLSGSLVRCRGNIEIEHSVSQARGRNRCALVGLFILALLTDRYKLYPADFLGVIPQAWQALATLSVLVSYIILRAIIFTFFRLPKLDSESRKAAHTAIYNYFLAFLPLMLASIGILWIFKANDSVVRWTLWVETFAFLWLTLRRKGQILSLKYSPLKTFLYLCALEVLPFACLVIPAVLL